MADMLVKLYNIPHSHDIEENLLKSGIRIKKALAPDRSRIINFARTCAKDDYSDEVQDTSQVYDMQSAPWYTGILYYGIFTIVPLIIAIIIKLFLWRKLKQKK